MSTVTTPALHPGQAGKLAVLLDAVDGMAISDSERRSLYWLSGWEAHTVENLAAMLRRARAAGPPA